VANRGVADDGLGRGKANSFPEVSCRGCGDGLFCRATPPGGDGYVQIKFTIYGPLLDIPQFSPVRPVGTVTVRPWGNGNNKAGFSFYVESLAVVVPQSVSQRRRDGDS
jgi:hypothetical protein